MKVKEGVYYIQVTGIKLGLSKTKKEMITVRLRIVSQDKEVNGARVYSYFLLGKKYYQYLKDFVFSMNPKITTIATDPSGLNIKSDLSLKQHLLGKICLGKIINETSIYKGEEKVNLKVKEYERVRVKEYKELLSWFDKGKGEWRPSLPPDAKSW